MSTGGYSDRVLELTPRMRQVLASAAAGHTAGETARELNVSEATVRVERAAALARLGARNVVQAVAIGVRSGAL